MGEKIKITTMHSGQLHSHHCFISFLRAKNCYIFFLLPETSLFPSFQVGKMLRRRFLEIFAMGRLQSNSSPDVPGLEVTFLSIFHTVSPVAWDGLVSEYEVGFQYLCIASQSTPRASPFRGFHCVSYSVGGPYITSKMSHAWRGNSRIFPVSDLCGHSTHLAACSH